MDHIPAPAVAGNCANCNHPTDQHDPRCPTLRCDVDWGSATLEQRCVRADGHGGNHVDRSGHQWPVAEYQDHGDDHMAYQGKHALPQCDCQDAPFPTEPQPAIALGYDTDGGWTGAEDPAPLPASVFGQPPADLTYAKAKARALIAEFEIWVNSPGVVWDDAASGAWMGQACSILAELAK